MKALLPGVMNALLTRHMIYLQVIPSGQFSQFFVLDATDQLSRGMPLLKKGRVTMGSTDSAISRKKELNLERPDCVFTS